MDSNKTEENRKIVRTNSAAVPDNQKPKSKQEITNILQDGKTFTFELDKLDNIVNEQNKQHKEKKIISKKKFISNVVKFLKNNQNQSPYNKKVSTSNFDSETRENFNSMQYQR